MRHLKAWAILSALLAASLNLAHASDEEEAPYSAPVAPAATAASAANVILIKGAVFIQKGKILFDRPEPGELVALENPDPKATPIPGAKKRDPFPPHVEWNEEAPRRKLAAASGLDPGDVLQTPSDGFVKLLLADQSILDVGPDTVLEVAKFDYSPSGSKRDVLFRLLSGRVRTIVPRPLGSGQRFALDTPSASMRVRGTEFLVEVKTDGGGGAQTQIACVHGQVSVDVTNRTRGGLIYLQPVVVNPGTGFRTATTDGIGKLSTTQTLPKEEMHRMMAAINPQVENHATDAAAPVSARRLPGTGLNLQTRAATSGGSPQNRSIAQFARTFDPEHPPADQQLAMPTGNFEMPKSFSLDPAAFGQLPDLHQFIGPAPISQAPLGNSRVHILLKGL